ncbi:MAG: hypothetical protein H6Q60_617 [Oscillospiraceae bacterium]|nr:hypothetical protein [Oscillospiraceae bacterium]
MKSNAVKQTKKPNIFVRLFAFLLTVLLLLGALLLIFHRDTLNLDAVVRYFSYRSLTRSDTGEAASFSYEGNSGSLFASIGNDLLTASTSGVHLYSQSGTQYISDTMTLGTPLISSSGDMAVVYDAGGSNLYVYQNREQVFALTDIEGTILSACVNDSGWLTVTTHETGYKAVITIYDSDFQKQAAFQISSSYITDASLSDDCNTLAAVAIGQQGTAFDSSVYFYQLNNISDSQTELTPSVTYSLGNDVVLSTMWQSGHLWLMQESALTVLSDDGSVLSQTDWSSRYLKSFALSRDGFCAVLTGAYRSGTESSLAVYAYDGSVLGETDMDVQVLSLSASGHYLSLLTSDRLSTYLTNLSLYHELDSTQSAKEVLQRDDGSVFLISSTAAWLCIPD